MDATSADEPVTSIVTRLELRPDLAALYGDLLAKLWTSGLDPTVLELCRVRQAQLLGCAPEVARRSSWARQAGVDEQLVQQVSSWPTSPAFDATQRACLTYTEAFVIDAHGVTDADAAKVRDACGEAGLVALTMALGLFDGLCRLRLSLEPAVEVS